MEFLNKKKLCSVPCKVIFLPDYDSVKNITMDNGVGFALYYPGSNTMYVAGDMSGIDDLPTEEDRLRVILISIAHEYIHHLQEVEGRDFDEEEAHSKADELVKEFLSNKEA